MKLCLSIPEFLALIAERPAKCRPTSPLHSEGVDVGGINGVKVIVGWQVEGEFKLEEELKAAISEKKGAKLRPLETKPFLDALEALLDQVCLDGDELDSEKWRKQYYEQLCDEVGSPEAVLREVHEEDDDEECSDREFQRFTSAAEQLSKAAYMVAKGKASAGDFVVFSDRTYGSEEGYGVRAVYLGSVVKCATAEEFARAVTVAAKKLEEVGGVGDKAGRKTPPFVFVDGDYESGNCWDEC